MKISDKIDHIELKIRYLASKQERLLKENTELKTQNELLKTELDKQRGAVSALKEKLAKTQVVLDRQPEKSPQEALQLKQQLDQYIREIDKCIEWLNNG